MVKRSRAHTLIARTKKFADDVDKLKFASPVAYVYNPLKYAWRPAHAYLRRFASSTKDVVFLGMNPGPFGMTQTGVPFGEVGIVRDWLGIDEKVEVPEHMHTKRPIEGFDCRRTEVSGVRFWGLIRSQFDDADIFFERHFVASYCPLVFLEESGRNRTPDKLPRSEQAALQALCDANLADFMRVLEPGVVVGVGVYAATCATRVVLEHKLPVRVGRMLHPSPASPVANHRFASQALAELHALGIFSGSDVEKQR